MQARGVSSFRGADRNLTQGALVRYRSAGMFRVALLTILALAAPFRWGTAVAQEEAADGGEPAATPQAEDREAPPMDKSAKPQPQAKPEAKPQPKAEAKPQPKAEAKPQPKAEAKPEPNVEPPPASESRIVSGNIPRVTAHAYEEESTGALADAVEGGLAEELGADARLKFIPLFDILDPPDAVPRSLGEADLDTVDSDDAMAQGDTDKAKQLLEKALVTYQKYLPQLASRGGGLLPFRDAWIKLARARFFDGDQKGARDAMRYVFIVDPTLKWDAKIFPPAMKKVVVESRLLFETLGPGLLTIDSDPPDATVYLNGVRVEKTTPVERVPAPPGPNYISFVRRGWQPVTAIFEVAGGSETGSAVRALEHYPGRPLQPLNRARLELEKPGAPPTLKDGAAKLGVDMLVLVRLGSADSGGTRLVAYLYDARVNKILKREEKTTTDEQVGATARELGRELLAGVPLNGVMLAPAPPKAPSLGERMAASMRRFRHSKAFWYVVGGVAGVVVVGAAVGLGVGLAPHSGLTPGEQVVLIGGH